MSKTFLGEFRGDFTRNTFDPSKHFLRVLMQQGRVQLDADWNEQTSILLHFLQSLARDLIGPYGGPADLVNADDRVLEQRCGFEVITKPDRIDVLNLTDQDKEELKKRLEKTKLLIGKGSYYVDGILCENEKNVAFSDQLGSPEFDISSTRCLFFLDVWERHITYLEDKQDGNPNIREVALGITGPDTTTRSKIVWQIRTTDKMPNDQDEIPAQADRKTVEANWNGWIEKWQPSQRGSLIAKAKEAPKESEPCIISPQARYRGTENQLYRVEIHRRGDAWDPKLGSDNKTNNDNRTNAATFKWSRENGSVVFPIHDIDPDDNQTIVTLGHLGRDKRLSLEIGDWVEIVNDDSHLQETAAPLLRVKKVDFSDHRVTLEGETEVTADRTKHPLLRRWDHRERKSNATEANWEFDGGAVLLKEGEWIMLEDGVQIQFQKPEGEEKQNSYRTGDYWLIPARVATGDVEWSKDAKGENVPQPPHGVEHHYAPLAIVENGEVHDLRWVIKLAAEPINS